MDDLELLKNLHEKLKAFPFNNKTKEELYQMDLKKISNEHLEEIEADEIKNAIVWSSDVLLSLLNELPVKTLDETISFVKYVLNKNN